MSRKLTADDAYRALHERILTGTLKPGMKLREAEIAESLGLSRTPVREALRRLESDGLIAHEAHKGAVVRQLDYQAISELYQIREVLEGTAAGLAARQISEVELGALEDMLDVQHAARHDAAEASRLNRIFHRTLCHCAHNRYLIEMLDGLDLSMMLLGRSTLGLDERKDAAIEEHRAILAAIAERDAAAAEEAARAHIRAAHRARLRIVLEDGAG